MKILLSDIEKISLSISGEKLFEELDMAYKLISESLKKDHHELLKDDFEFYKSKGRYWVFNTFAGGIIFLREPEVIEEIRILLKTKSNEVIASVEYGSENRNQRNVKYKPNAGKIESTEWNMLGIFPNFSKYERLIQIALLMLIGRHVKDICEELHRESWFMRYEKGFTLNLYLDGKLEKTFDVEA